MASPAKIPPSADQLSPTSLLDRIRKLEDENRRYKIKEQLSRQSGDTSVGTISSMSDMIGKIVLAARKQQEANEAKISSLLALVENYESKVKYINSKLGEVVVMHNALIEEYNELRTYIHEVDPLQPPRRGYPKLELQVSQSTIPRESTPELMVIDTHTHQSVPIEIQEFQPVAVEESPQVEHLVLSAVERSSSHESSEYTDSTVSP